MKTTIGVFISVVVCQTMLAFVLNHFAPLLVTTNAIGAAAPTPNIWNVLFFTGNGLGGMFAFDGSITVLGGILATVFWLLTLIDVICIIFLIRGD
jgi:hypothetical protein